MYKKILSILELLLNLVTARIEAFVTSCNEFLIFVVCMLLHILDYEYLWTVNATLFIAVFIFQCHNMF
jgi:hypothetical protein